MNKLLISVLLSLGLVGVSHAAGDAAAGKDKAAACGACHGADGNSAAAFPKLAGQNERYLIKQMKDIRCGFLSADEQKAKKCSPRSVPQMAGQLDGKSDQDLADIAAYFASQVSTGGQAKEALVEKGAAVYRGGIASKGIPACMGCHSPTGQGNAPAGFPALAGQYADYIAAQLKAFRAAADGDMNGRANDGDTSMMRDVAKNLSDSEIEAVASYISGLY